MSGLGVQHWIAVLSLAAAPLVLVALWAGDVIRPASLERGGKRAVAWQPWWVWFFAGIVVFFAQQLGGVAMAGFSWLTGGSADSVRGIAVISLAGMAAGAAAGIAMLRLFAGAGGGNSGLRFRFSDIPIGLAAFALAMPVFYAASLVSTFISQKVTGVQPDRIAHRGLEMIVRDRAGPWSWVLAATAVFGAPVVEEIVYRGFLQSALLRVFGRAWPAVIITALLFGAAHLPDDQVPVHAAVSLAVLGVAMGIAFERTRRLGVPIVMHVAFNALNIVLAIALR